MFARGKGDLETIRSLASIARESKRVYRARGDSAAGIASRKSNPRGLEKSRTDRYAHGPRHASE